MSPPASTVQTRVLTLAREVRALENKPVTSRILELSMPELQSGDIIPVVALLWWDFVLAMCCCTAHRCLKEKLLQVHCYKAFAYISCSGVARRGTPQQQIPGPQHMGLSAGPLKACSLISIFFPPSAYSVWEWSTSVRESWEGNF